MPEFSRRAVLSGAGAGTLLMAAPGLPAVASPASDMDKVLSNTVAIFAGTKKSNSSDAVADKLAAIDKTARNRLKAMDKAGDGELFSGLPLGSDDANLKSSYDHLYDIALATRVPQPPDNPSGLAGDTDTQDTVIDGLRWLYDHYFGDQDEGYYGNWYNWEIGIPHAVSLTLVLLNARIRKTHPKLPDTYADALDGYLRHGKDGDVDLDSRFHTGANLADITTNRILQGAVLGQRDRITKAVADQMTVFETIDPYQLRHGVKDGYYADGSFIQHDSVAYTGAYGRVLLTRVTQTIKILDGTGFVPDTDLVPTVHGWLKNGFAPVIFEGWMMELVLGRQVSSRKSGYATIRDVIEATVDLAGYSTGDAADQLKGYLKYLAGHSKPEPDPTKFTSPVSVLGYAQIVADDGIEAADLNPAKRSVAFNAMDVHVHRRPGYAFALSRSSDRISKYEYMSGQNLQPWFQGDGAHYLYLSGQDQKQAYGVNYYTDVSPYRLSGITCPVDKRKTIPELYGKDWYENPDSPLHFTSSSESQNKYVYFPRGTNTYSGAAVLDDYAISGMIKSDSVPYRDKQKGILPDDFVAYQNAESTSSWIMLDDEIVILTAGIRDPADRDVITTLDSRIADPDDTVELVGELRNGDAWNGTGDHADLAWLRYHNPDQQTAVGYLLLDRTHPDVSQDTVSNPLSIVRESNPDTKVSKKVFNLSVTHPAGGDAPGTLAYAVVPNASTSRLQGYRRHDGNRIEVVSNTTRLQAVRHHDLGLTALNTFSSDRHRLQPITVVGSASVIMRETSDEISVAVSDPTMQQDRVNLDLELSGLQPRHADDGVRVISGHRNTRLRVNTQHAYGRSFTVTLAKH